MRGRTEAELAEARRQVESMLHKLEGVVRTLEARGADGSRKAQITLAKRRVAALETASGLIAEALEAVRGGNVERESAGNPNSPGHGRGFRESGF